VVHYNGHVDFWKLLNPDANISETASDKTLSSNLMNMRISIYSRTSVTALAMGPLSIVSSSHCCPYKPILLMMMVEIEITPWNHRWWFQCGVGFNPIGSPP